MTSRVERFPYVETDRTMGPVGALPFMPLILGYQQQEIAVSGLVDSGATVNVLPYDLGVRLGALWERQLTPVRLTGNLAEAEARAIVLMARVGQFRPARLIFAWTRSDRVPLILGQMNFFLEFDVCFSRSRLFFEIKSKGTADA